MVRVALFLLLSIVALPAYADPMVDIDAAIFENSSNANGDVKTIKAELRKCTVSNDCKPLLVLFRWRPVANSSAQFVENAASRIKPECKWPKPPAVPPVVKCMDRLCTIPPDGKHY